MSTVLFVKANPRPFEQAVSVKLYDAFLDAYKNVHPEDEIVELDLFAEKLPYYDLDMINGMYKLANGLELSPEEEKAADLVQTYLNQFLAADKVVFAFPMWNFTIPAVLHNYLDYLCQAGKTFRYTPEGPVGLLADKKVAILHARGGVYSEEPMASREMAANYVTQIMNFLGVQEVQSVIVEGHNQYPERSEAIIQEGIEKAKKLAAEF
ncbi:FMN-dependent NADH-azoreductase [Thermoflavimicrobium dichotomicum]|uniref:FMN dependent NADH:quinone oxidoreductase n=1 Tax=Thermoflavimicrobium dichotomicum TaxID=46223 RepID=A0A1I3S0X9_9BACL|nr:FMN-dependent NADH-azoreductase [Thermoflavimicrobium dichotomicum]SFJ51176.1 FMN-dependent NADH-azoreductase [Thermoflavimicrobium dichotomicum]